MAGWAASFDLCQDPVLTSLWLRLCLSTFCEVTFVASPSLAIEPADAAPTEARDVEQPEREWYGGETLLVDLVFIGTLAVSLPEESAVGTTIGIAGLCLGGPVVHGAHGQVEKALASGALRVGLPGGGALVGVAVSKDPDTRGRGALIGALSGLGAAITLDAALLAWQPTERKIRPTASASSDGFTLGAVGEF